MLQLVCGGPTLAQPWFSSNKIIGGGGGGGGIKLLGGALHLVCGGPTLALPLFLRHLFVRLSWKIPSS